MTDDDDDRLPWFPCFATKLLGALAAMPPDQQLVYQVVLLRIYEVRGPCPDGVGAIARRVGINKRRVTDALVALGSGPKPKLVQGATGLMNPYAAKVLAKTDALREERARAGAAGGTAAAQKRKQKQADPPSKAPANQQHLHLQEDSLFSTRTAPDEKPALPAVVEQLASPSPSDPVEAERQLFIRGKEVLGKNAGGMIRNLLAAKTGNVALARAAIEQASTKASPREFVGAMIRPGGPRGKGGNGFAAVAARMIQQGQEEQNARRKPTEPVQPDERSVSTGGRPEVHRVPARNINR